MLLRQQHTGMIDFLELQFHRRGIVTCHCLSDFLRKLNNCHRIHIRAHLANNEGLLSAPPWQFYEHTVRIS